MKSKNTLLNIGICILVVVLIASGILLGKMLYTYKAEDKANKDIAANAVISVPIENSSSNTESSTLTVDFSYLNAINSDCIGYIYVPGTNISYPIVQGEDNEKYLDTSFSNTTTKSGSIFLDSRNKPYLSDSINLIYGHNMKDGSMFANLNNYDDEAYYKEHGEVYITLTSDPSQNIPYKIVSVVLTNPTDEDIYDFSFENLSKEELVKRLVNIKSKSLYETSNAIDFDKPVVILSTCRSNGTKRMCLVLQRIE